MRTAFFALSFIFTAGLLGGCSGTAPTLTLTEAFVAERAPDGGGPVVVHVVVRADNPTSEPLAMWATAYSGASGGGVERWAQATAPARGSVVFELPVVVAAGAASPLAVSGKVDYVPGGRFRELLSELDVPLPSTSFSSSLPIDWSAAPRTATSMRAGAVRSATVLDPGPPRSADTLPPLKPTP
ncbi:MAG TPA: hypothetical protein VEB22_04045 [Phycisphaerales bacterium]|nr:hypothetical protein [Phycisphaerales bacterium]